VAFTIRFLPEDRATLADEPLDLFLAAARCDIWVEQPCGAKTVCAKCRVRVRSGEVPPSPADTRLLSPQDLDDGWRLGCQLTLGGDAEIEVPPQTRSTAAVPATPRSLLWIPAQRGRRPSSPSRTARACSGYDRHRVHEPPAARRRSRRRACGSQSRVNPQVRYGADVISRICYAQEHADGNALLHRAVTAAIGEMIAGLADQAGVPAGRIFAIACAGRT
jgi:uncharacterized 2Fe-2S/4Fe-4S cluster protein (DUF4445 family)